MRVSQERIESKGMIAKSESSIFFNISINLRNKVKATIKRSKGKLRVSIVIKAINAEVLRYKYDGYCRKHIKLIRTKLIGLSIALPMAILTFLYLALWRFDYMHGSEAMICIAGSVVIIALALRGNRLYE